jgi:membrane-associated PAP2 superfamily phosphatase
MFDTPPQRQLSFAAAISALSLLSLIALEFTDVDRQLAHLSFDPATGGFPLQNDALLAWSHKALKLCAAAAFLWILAALWRPLGVLRRLDRLQRVYLLVSVSVCLVVVAALKRASALDCPWGIAEFGGRAPYLRLFEQVPADWLRGGCFPAGHVVSAFAFIGGWFAFAPRHRAVARAWLLAVLLVGALAGAAQQMRGAHFLSHTLWSLWWCWTLAAGLAWLFARRLPPVNQNSATAQ